MKKIYIRPLMTVQQMNPTDVLMNSGINLVDSGNGNDEVFNGAKERDEEPEIDIQDPAWGNLW